VSDETEFSCFLSGLERTAIDSYHDMLYNDPLLESGSDDDGHGILAVNSTSPTHRDSPDNDDGSASSSSANEDAPLTVESSDLGPERQPLPSQLHEGGKPQPSQLGRLLPTEGHWTRFYELPGGRWRLESGIRALVLGVALASDIHSRRRRRENPIDLDSWNQSLGSNTKRRRIWEPSEGDLALDHMWEQVWYSPRFSHPFGIVWF